MRFALLNSLLGIVAALALVAGLYDKNYTFLVFLAWVFFWQGEQNIRKKYPKNSWQVYGFVSVFLITWNYLATLWIELTGALWVVVIANSLVMLFALRIWFFSKKHLSPKWHYITFVAIWIAFEYLHHHWQLTWIWLTLGNLFLYQNKWVQWYEYTGVLGGSLWILLVNLLFFKALNAKYLRNFVGQFMIVAIMIVLPLLLSRLLFQQDLKKEGDLQVLLIQPNINPFTEKFKDGKNFIPLPKQTDILLHLSKQKLSPSTDLVVFPETALDENLTESFIKKYANVSKMDSFFHKKNTDFILGASTRQFYKYKKTPSSMYYKPVNAYYEDFNVAIHFQKDSFSIYRKMILVPGVETIPFPSYTVFLKDFISNVGAQFFLLGKGTEQSIFQVKKAKIAPIICYESMYAGFVANFAAQGANLLCTITNDGWLGDTPWQKHHLYLGALRSIETRKSMLHCSNMGESGFISPKGEVMATVPYNQRTSIEGKVALYEGKTFYVRYGDYLGKIAVYVVLILVIFTFLKKLKRGYR
ncbi:MAG: apolipoprotein N-acyltransferase [Thermonemataceae bacterium]|nr:apolipoprotein N-acyltransferase [Thermonemataceae bacterium]